MGIGGEDGTKRVVVLNDAVDDVDDVTAADVVAVTVEVVEGGKRV